MLAIRFREDLNRIAPFWREVGEPDAVEDTEVVGVHLPALKGKLVDLLSVILKGTYKEKDGTEKSVAVCIGPEYGTVGRTVSSTLRWRPRRVLDLTC